MAEKYEDRNNEGFVETLARDALAAFRADAPKAYATLVKEYDGQGAIVGIFGMGSVSLSVNDGEVRIGKASAMQAGKSPVIARGATYPETIVAISRGEITPLEAFHAGDLVVRAPSEELHKAFGFMVKFSDVAIGSKGLQRILARLQERTGIR